MTTPDIDFILDRWLTEGTDVLPDRSVEAVLRTVDRTTQRRAWGVPWRAQTMWTAPRSAIATLTIIAFAVIGTLVLGPRLGEPAGTDRESPSPTSSPARSELPSPAPSISDSMWPQSSIAQVQQAQELADAGDPRYTWQVDPGLDRGLVPDDPRVAAFVARFFREQLGWERFVSNPFVPGGESLRNVVYIRCAPGGTNPLYPVDPTDDQAGGCAPTIDELRYETVSLDLAQPGRQGPTGLWVVSRWARMEPFAQTKPPTAEAEALLGDFLQARIAGKGAEQYLEISGAGHMLEEFPLLYATTTGASYERSEFERVGAPEWPDGNMAYKVRLFAEGGKTMVEQLLSAVNEGGRLRLEYRAGPRQTTENGQPVPMLYGLFEGDEVTFRAAFPWADMGTDRRGAELGLAFNKDSHDRFELVHDPRPVETGCEPGPVPADAEALARAIRFDPDLEATAPVAVTVGGAAGLRMDLTAAPGRSDCDGVPGRADLVMRPGSGITYGGTPSYRLTLDNACPARTTSRPVRCWGYRTRLYLVNLPDGSAARVLAIAISAPETRFEQVVEAAAPLVDSIEFHAP